MRAVALPKPTEYEKGQWFFQRYIQELLSSGEIVVFDRSLYSRAVVEPVMGFCSKEQHERFLCQVPEFEYMFYEDGMLIFKLWLSIDVKEQKARLESIRYVLSRIAYTGKTTRGVSFECDPDILQVYSPSIDSSK